MAEIEPLRALHYDPAVTGGLQDVVAPPYDVIDAEQRAALVARSPYNVVEIDLPQPTHDERGNQDDREEDDRYDHAADILHAWREEGVVVTDDAPALWTIAQEYTGPDGERRTRRGFFARVRVEEYGPGRIRPHERTHPGPKEDRLRLTRATRTNLSPIFALYNDPTGEALAALTAAAGDEDWATTTDEDGTVNHLRRVGDPVAIATAQRVLAGTELLIADGHHRYETARVYAEEIGGDGPHRFVLMCLVALQDPGLTVFPTHRLVNELTDDAKQTLQTTINLDFTIEPLAEMAALQPPANDDLKIGYLPANGPAVMLTLRNDDKVNEALADHAAPYRRLDTAVLEALILNGALGMTDDDIDNLNGLGYARDFDQAVELVADGAYDAAFFMAPTPIERVAEVAEAGESMPPKSTYFFPKVPTGLLFSPLT